jgi:hypothetical protein
VYIDLNRVRAGVVDHPVNWKHSGYQEIQTPLSRYSIIDRVKLRELLEIGSDQMLIDTHRGWVEDALKRKLLNDKTTGLAIWQLEVVIMYAGYRKLWVLRLVNDRLCVTN